MTDLPVEQDPKHPFGLRAPNPAYDGPDQPGPTRPVPMILATFPTAEEAWAASDEYPSPLSQVVERKPGTAKRDPGPWDICFTRPGE